MMLSLTGSFSARGWNQNAVPIHFENYAIKNKLFNLVWDIECVTN